MKLPTKESDEQIAFIEWLHYFKPEIYKLTHHSPGEGKRTGRYMNWLKRLGFSPGFPDVAIYVRNSTYSALFFEFKPEAERNRKKRPTQESWLYNLNQEGYLAMYVYSAQQAINITTEYLANR